MDRKNGQMSEEGWTSANTLRPTCHALTVITKNTNPSLVTQGFVGNKPHLVTEDMGRVTVARPDTAGWPERQPNQYLKFT